MTGSWPRSGHGQHVVRTHPRSRPRQTVTPRTRPRPPPVFPLCFACESFLQTSSSYGRLGSPVCEATPLWPHSLSDKYPWPRSSEPPLQVSAGHFLSSASLPGPLTFILRPESCLLLFLDPVSDGSAPYCPLGPALLLGQRVTDCDVRTGAGPGSVTQLCACADKIWPEPNALAFPSCPAPLAAPPRSHSTDLTQTALSVDPPAVPDPGLRCLEQLRLAGTGCDPRGWR